MARRGANWMPRLTETTGPQPPGPSRLPPAVVICGPTAAGKTGVAMVLAERFETHLISADSVQVFRGMDVGSAKPSPELLARYPHALIDIRDPEQGWSAAEFAALAAAEMQAAASAGRLPVIVGGTAMHLRALRYGMDRLPGADAALRARIADQAARNGWPALHAELARLDPESGRRIHPGDPQRIQRALEICRLTGQPASSLQHGRGPDLLRDSQHLVIAPADRGKLHRRIDRRWRTMLEQGLLEEVEMLTARAGLDPDSPALRAIGYRQAVDCLRGVFPAAELPVRGAAATRQLAKRQLTAFRQWSGGMWYDPLNKNTIDRIIRRIARMMQRTNQSRMLDSRQIAPGDGKTFTSPAG